MKQKIAEVLKTKYKSFGLSNEAFDRIASAKEKTVTEEAQIADAVADVETMSLIAQELQKMRDKEIQTRTDLQTNFDNYKAKHPDKTDDDDDDDDDTKNKQKPLTAEAIAQLVKDAATEAVKTVKEEFDAYKNAHSAKEAATNAKSAFYENKWTTKFKEEADDAWERVSELNEAKGGSMTEDEMKAKAKEYFDKAVQKKGTDTTKPFEEGKNEQQNADFSELANRYESEGKIPAKEQ